MGSPSKQYLNEEDLLVDSFRLAVSIFDSGFKPDFIVGIWRGVDPPLESMCKSACNSWIQNRPYFIRTSYEGLQSYAETISKPETIRMHDFAVFIRKP